NYLKRILPKGVSVGTGFVRDGDKLTSQIDIIIYTEDIPLLFSEGDFIITTPDNVLGIIEVKSNIKSSDIQDIIIKANNNGFIIGRNNERAIFNGIFSYEHKNEVVTYGDNIEGLNYSDIVGCPTIKQRATIKSYQCVNHIALGSKTFIKYFPTGYPHLIDYTYEVKNPYYGIYDMSDDLAFAYFISNLQEYILENTLPIYKQNNCDFEELFSFFYPIEGGKETRLIREVHMK
ncbi:MAG: hypothetical protein J6B21_09655, partial [Oscillospiraceae bacterium]|nr:hypothetical protein [Oscillospiraceae bacterium]